MLGADKEDLLRFLIQQRYTVSMVLLYILQLQWCPYLDDKFKNNTMDNSLLKYEKFWVDNVRRKNAFHIPVNCYVEQEISTLLGDGLLIQRIFVDLRH